MVSPDTGDGFDAPTPEEAYATAPALRREMHDVMELGAIRDGRRAGIVTEPPPADIVAADRTYLLRRAALMDRMAVDDPGPGARGAATRAAFELAEFDHRHPQVIAGPHGPRSIEFDPSQRPYVRQEYAAWTAAGRPGSNS
ncbi:hypothetical protein [Streptomyces violarus]|uniref:hypothetical protein n=1 Tax=Streptomyces violarus TaxID=67380 RepID=UPI0021BF416D|nr:hypothetical protein [Streptomyces violarus]MCT9142411.1 hypothetical protein [Streptomyces violarus]